MIEGDDILEQKQEARAGIDLGFVQYWIETKEGTQLLDDQNQPIALVTAPDFEKLSKMIIETKKETQKIEFNN